MHATMTLRAALEDAIKRLEGWMEADCECDNTHEQHDTECCLCQYRRALEEHSEA